MAIQTLTTIKNWFKSTLKPTEAQYRDTWDSFYHKLEGIGISAITNLSNILNNKADVGQLDGKADKGHGHVVGDTEDLENILENKADKTHSHNIDDVDGLQDTFNDQYLYFNNAVNDEITQRKEADEALQDEIDSLKKITMIRGNVDTYADLLAMDTAIIREGDSYIVEVDETKAGKSTLYVWSNVGWVYTGEWASGGGSSENLGNTDLVQTSTDRIYEFAPLARTRDFIFDWSNKLAFYASKTLRKGIELETTGSRGTTVRLVGDSLEVKGLGEVNWWDEGRPLWVKPDATVCTGPNYGQEVEILRQMSVEYDYRFFQMPITYCLFSAGELREPPYWAMDVKAIVLNDENYGGSSTMYYYEYGWVLMGPFNFKVVPGIPTGSALEMRPVVKDDPSSIDNGVSDNTLRQLIEQVLMERGLI